MRTLLAKPTKSARHTEPYLLLSQNEKGLINLLEICPVKQGAAVTWTALTGRRCTAGKAKGSPAQTFERGGGEPTMRKGSYSEELVRIVAAMNTKEIDVPTAMLEASRGRITFRRQHVESRKLPRM